MTTHSSGSDVLVYYDSSAQSYVDRTWGLDMATVRSRFTALLPPSAAVLDAGCGSGRDALAFSREGYNVHAFDGSAELVARARCLTGLPIEHLRYDQLSFEAKFEGVWACSSLVHLSDEQLSDVLARIHRALRHGGVFYTCFKEGPGPRIDEAGRPFNDFTKERLRVTLRAAGFTPKHAWRTPQVVPGAGFWLNVLVSKL